MQQQTNSPSTQIQGVWGAAAPQDKLGGGLAAGLSHERDAAQNPLVGAILLGTAIEVLRVVSESSPQPGGAVCDRNDRRGVGSPSSSPSPSLLSCSLPFGHFPICTITSCIDGREALSMVQHAWMSLCTWDGTVLDISSILPPQTRDRISGGSRFAKGISTDIASQSMTPKAHTSTFSVYFWFWNSS